MGSFVKFWMSFLCAFVSCLEGEGRRTDLIFITEVLQQYQRKYVKWRGAESLNCICLATGIFCRRIYSKIR